MVDLFSLKDELVEVSRRRVELATTRMTNDLKRGAPKVTGELARKTGVEIVSASSNRITAAARIDVSYAAFVTEGTRFHTIRPKRSDGVLVFKIGGVTVFAKKVNHPGNDPNPFFEKVVSRWRLYLNNAA
jgi:hypothetical protein